MFVYSALDFRLTIPWQWRCRRPIVLHVILLFHLSLVVTGHCSRILSLCVCLLLNEGYVHAKFVLSQYSCNEAAATLILPGVAQFFDSDSVCACTLCPGNQVKGLSVTQPVFSQCHSLIVKNLASDPPSRASKCQASSADVANTFKLPYLRRRSEIYFVPFDSSEHSYNHYPSFFSLSSKTTGGSSTR